MTMSASNSGKRAVPLIVVLGELCTPLTVATLPLPPFTPQSKEVQMDDAGGDDLGNNNIAVATTPIQIVKTLKIYEPDLDYGNQDKLKG